MNAWIRGAALLLALGIGGPAVSAALPDAHTVENTATEDVVLPEGYVIEPVVTGLTYPTGIEFGPDGSLYLAEAGYSYGQHWTHSRVLRIRPDGTVLPLAHGFKGPIMGITLRGDQLYVSHRGTISVVDLAASGGRPRVRDIVTGLPALPNSGHFNSRVAFDDNGKMYFAVGVITNSGVPTFEEVLFGWLPDFPWMHDAPAKDVTLTGSNYPTVDVLGPGTSKPLTGGAYLPFGTPSKEGQTIPAHSRPTGAIYRANPDGTGLEVIAWGIRSPFGFAKGPDGRIYMTNHEMDDRGGRPAANAPDSLIVVEENAWYGWPDYIAGIPITDPRFKPNFPLGKRPEFVMKNHPPVTQPLVRFTPHAADMGFDWSHSDRFGHRGEMFMVEFGTGEPITTALRSEPKVGFGVLRLNPERGTRESFLDVRNPGMETTKGPMRPIDVRFHPRDGDLYLLDFGVMTVRLSLGQVGFNPLPETGTVWRVRRRDASSGGFNRLVRVDGEDLVSWWMARSTMVGVEKALRSALLYAQKMRMTDDPMLRSRWREQALTEMRSVGGVAAIFKRTSGPKVHDNGTRMLLSDLEAWASSPLLEPMRLHANEPILRRVREWLQGTEWPEKEYLFKNYAVSGRWQRPLEKDLAF
ncbi:MAG: PQQ-dependent sugar dehydrogenase [Armatimonadetes bacterium]|nr:PQQ-dependent sugar dehydrogenase [Armatimonadota bacterium]